MVVAFVFVLIVLTILVLIAQARPERPHRVAIKQGWEQLQPLLVRLPLALIAAAFIAQLLPEQAIADVFGEGSGWHGILAASLLGGLLPGGPMVAFPLIIIFLDAGAGTAQIISLLTSWSLLGLNRMAVYEIPMLGTRFTLARVITALPLPVAAGYWAGSISNWLQ
ncbi:hypothetical protein [Halorhodospira halochloris]|uniref:hypothetical protein n=1 Tax=Halorhodospira halochloris TaxID=1052 RepID=UPI001EE883AB|nr:hypothetical protein [Halorhodospira halochloris]MCG5548538.1 hypothetical protein [Halorhodospira halochloris]